MIRWLLLITVSMQFVANQLPLPWSCYVNPFEQVYRVRYIDALIKAKRNEDAMVQAKILNAIHPNDPMSSNMMSLAYVFNGNREMAVNELRHFMTMDPLFFRSN